MKLTRYAGNPILSPHPEHPWEDLAVFNPAAWYDSENEAGAAALPRGRVASGIQMLLRAGDQPGRLSLRARLAISRCSAPASEGSTARRSRIPGSSRLVNGFTSLTPAAIIRSASSGFLAAAIPYVKPPCPPEFPRYLRTNATLTGLAMTKDFKSWIRAGWLTDPLLDDRDAILFPEKVGGKFVMMHRPLEWVGQEYGTDEPCAWISMADDLLGFPSAGSRLLDQEQVPLGNGQARINTPPIKTQHGWLTIYHAVGPDKFYRLGALLLDLDDPGQRASPHARLADGARDRLRDRGLLPGRLLSVRNGGHR